ncbi:enoyl-CoA hydratase/isomerase family protein [Novosphingobium sp. YJ-S2-02]|uniref:Enoyl-CoA hydratase/isomerase family protein n=1 Tax=Novosphingobium aureum TaxID=2792964 RepID=A0A931HE26_9SPHN|nr:enoyl-CoA hydratase/isomerase family protein [Novosphingobium aureum]MBH0114420.1 enoyl-CoA hydratase/isomerase family protein [Novosphingobium aureum]
MAEMKSPRAHREDARKYIRYDKDRTRRIATITIDRPDRGNALTIGTRMLFADYVHRANVDDEVKVLVIRGEGEDFGTGADIDEHGDMYLNPKEGESFLPDLEIEPDEDVAWPPKGSYRHLHHLTDYYAKGASGIRPLQEFKKISIVEAKGYCYGWHFYQCGDADLVIASDDALFGHPSFRYAGWGPRMWTWLETIGYRKFAEMVFTGRPFTAAEMDKCGFLNSVVAREDLEAEVDKYADACARSRPVDVVVAQKTFMEAYKQYRGEYLGSLLTGWLEGMLPAMKPDRETAVDLGGDAFNEGIAKAVKNNDRSYPPEWRLSRQGRAAKE